MKDAPQVNLVIVRHGETLANKKWLVQGQIDVALNENGRRQAVAAGKALRKVHFDSAYSSDLSRAVDTAKAIVQANELFDGKVLTRALVRERGFGVLEGRPVEEVGKDYYDLTPEGGESRGQLRERAVKFLKELISDVPGLCEDCKNTNPTVLLVSHAGFIREFIGHLAEDLNCQFPEVADDDAAWDYNVVTPNTGISRFTLGLAEDGIVNLWCLELHSDAHLKGIARLQRNLAC